MRRSAPVIALPLLLAAAATAPGQADRHVNKIIRLLEEGEPVFGIFSGPKTAEQGERIVATGADFVFYSLERGPFDLATLQVYQQAMRRAGGEGIGRELPVVLRIPPVRDGRQEARERAAAALDNGVFGIVFPHVVTPGEAEVAVSAMRYRNVEDPPEGNRPLGDGAGMAPYFWNVSSETYRERADLWPLDPEGELVSMLLVEDRAGVRNAREIVGTKGVSIVFPGPGDLARAYEGDAEAVENAIQTVLAACKELDVPCGITAGVDDVAERLDQGFEVIIVLEPEAIDVGKRFAGRRN